MRMRAAPAVEIFPPGQGRQFASGTRANFGAGAAAGNSSTVVSVYFARTAAPPPQTAFGRLTLPEGRVGRDAESEWKK